LGNAACCNFFPSFLKELSARYYFFLGLLSQTTEPVALAT
jgi:hypothetical protein